MVQYPRNERGQPEFGSVVITLDHLQHRDDQHVVQKVVYSTQTAEDALLAIMRYFNEDHVADANSTQELIERGKGSDAIYSYVPPRGIVQLVLSTTTLANWIASPILGNGSMLMAVDKLVQISSQQYEQARAKLGKTPPLLLIQASVEPIQSQRPQRQRATVRAIDVPMPTDSPKNKRKGAAAKKAAAAAKHTTTTAKKKRRA